MKRMRAREMIIIRHLMLGMLFVTDSISIFKINGLIQVFEYDHANRYTKHDKADQNKCQRQNISTENDQNSGFRVKYSRLLII